MVRPAALLLLGVVVALVGCAVGEINFGGLEGDDLGEEAAEEEEAVLTLNSSTFDKAVKSTLRLVVVFWGEKCRRCRALAQEYWQAAEELLQKNATTRLAQVDTKEAVDNKAKDLVSRYKIEIFPTILYFFNGTRGERFNAMRNAASIKAWVLRREGKFIKDLEESEVEKFLSSGGFTFAVVARVKANTVRAKAFVQAVELMSTWDKKREVLPAVVWLPKSAHANSDASLFLERKGFEEPDVQRLSYTGAWTGNNLAKWAKLSTFRTIERTLSLERYMKNHEEFGWAGMLVALVDDARLTDEDTEEPLAPLMYQQMAAIAKVEVNWRFAVSELSKVNDGDFKTLGVQSHGIEPTLIVLKFSEPVKTYLLKGVEAMSEPDAVSSFFHAVRAGKVKQHYASEPLPDPAFEDGVRVLVGQNFDEHVMNASHDVFVKFYVPWCQHCQEMEPVWAEFAQTVEQLGWGSRGVVVAQFNAEDNECDEKVETYPKLVLYPAVGAKDKFSQRFVFELERQPSVDALQEFLLDNAVNLEGVADDRSDL